MTQTKPEFNHQSVDAQEWAKEFMRLLPTFKETIDEGLMIAWFANAIMAGMDEQARRNRPTDSGRGLDESNIINFMGKAKMAEIYIEWAKEQGFNKDQIKEMIGQQLLILQRFQPRAVVDVELFSKELFEVCCYPDPTKWEELKEDDKSIWRTRASIIGDNKSHWVKPGRVTKERIREIISECIKKEINEGYKQGGIYPDVVAEAISKELNGGEVG